MKIWTIPAIVVVAFGLLIGGWFLYQSHESPFVLGVESYTGKIWSNSPVNCDDDVSCMAKAAETCSPAKGKFIASYMPDIQINTNGGLIDEQYELGIQGKQFGKCQIYLKDLGDTFLQPEVSETVKADAPNSLQDRQVTNYVMCRFDNSSDTAALFSQGDYTAFGGKVDETYAFAALHGEINGDDGLNASTTNCYKHTYLDPNNLITSVGYDLARGQGIEDASENFRLAIQNIKPNISATFLIINNEQQQTITIPVSQTDTILGYNLNVKEFGESGTGAPLVNFVLSVPLDEVGLIEPTDLALPIGQAYQDIFHGFSFISPANFHVNSSTSEGVIFYQTPSDGEKENQGWPRIEIDYPRAPAYNPPSGASLVSWLKQNQDWLKQIPAKPNVYFGDVPAVKIYTPSSSQIYSQYDIYYIRNNQLFDINFDDVDSPGAQALYSQFLSSYQVLP